MEGGGGRGGSLTFGEERGMGREGGGVCHLQVVLRNFLLLFVLFFLREDFKKGGYSSRFGGVLLSLLIHFTFLFLISFLVISLFYRYLSFSRSLSLHPSLSPSLPLSFFYFFSLLICRQSKANYRSGKTKQNIKAFLALW